MTRPPPLSRQRIWGGSNNKGVEIGKYPVTEDGVSGWQACVRADTKLITRDGIVNIGETADAGKEVEIWNGEKWCKVTPFKTGTNKQFYRVVFTDGSYLDCTDNHKFAVKNRFEKEYRQLTTLELIDAINTEPHALSIPRANVVYEGGVSNSSAYEYGFVLGDGTVRREGRDIFAYVYHGSGKENLSFENVRVGRERTRHYPSGSSCSSSVRRYNQLNFEGLDPNFSYRLKEDDGLPTEIFSWDRESILKFVAGWADADGSNAGKGIRVYGQEGKIRDLQLLLTKVGINSSVNRMIRRGGYVESIGAYRRNDVWYVQITKTVDIPCQRLTCNNATEPNLKGKNQVIDTVLFLEDVVEDSYCLTEPEKHMAVFNNALTYQCNLVEINGGKCVTPEDFYLACKAGAIIGTLQAGYTNFKFLSEATKRIVEREALLGVSITGWMNNPDVLFDEDILRRGAQIVKEVNAEVAALIGINPAARTTCAKPAGSTSVILGTASGIHGEHAPRYIRNIEINKDLEVGHELARVNPVMIEDSVWKQNTYCASFPITAPANSIFKKDLVGIGQLEYVKKAQQVWVEEGTNVELCTDPALRHNISNTIQVEDWDEIEEYIYENRWWFAGISLLDVMGDRDYPQAPFTTVLTGEEIVQEYGDAAMFASGLIVEGVKAFGDLWKACEQIEDWATPLPDGSATLLKRDWVRRLRKFADNYFDGDLKKATYCLKDVYNLHRWNKICREIKPIDWNEALTVEHLTDVDTMGAIACAGGVCEWTPPEA